MSSRHDPPAPGDLPAPPQRIGTWWERLRGSDVEPSVRGASSLSGGAAPRGSTVSGRFLLVRVSSVVFGLVGVGVLALAPIQREENRAMRGAAVCAADAAERELQDPDSPTCLVRVPGAIDDYREGSGRYANLRWHFQPTPGSPADASGAWVRFRGDSSDEASWTPVQRALFSGEPAVAYYWGEDPVVFETPAGRLETGTFREGAWMSLVWAGSVSLALAVLHPLSSWVRRRRGH